MAKKTAKKTAKKMPLTFTANVGHENDSEALAVYTDNGTRVVFASVANRDEFTRRCDAQDIKYKLGE